MNAKKMMALVCAAAMILPAIPVAANEELTGSLTIWEHEYGSEESLKAVIEGFQELYPNVEIDYEIKASSYEQLLSTALQSGEGPDLFYTSGAATNQMREFAENDMIIDLSDIVDYSLMTEDAMNRCTLDGKQYSVPWLVMDSRACFYNKDMFEENGWSVPTTFTEFENLLATIKEAGITPISQSYGSWDLLFIWEPVMSAYAPDTTRAFDTDVTAVYADGVRDSLLKLKEWADAGYFGENWLGVLSGDDMVLGFTTGNAAMMINGTWNISTIDQNNPDLNYGAFAIPAEDGTAGLVGTAANGFSVNAKSESLDAAKAFVAYCAGKEGQTAWVKAMGSVSASPEIEASHPIAQEISQSGGGVTFRSWQNAATTGAVSDDINTVWEEDIVKVFSGEITVEDMMTAVKGCME